MEVNYYNIDCTGNCCVHDEITFERAVYDGSYPNATFSHNERVKGVITKESYGKSKQQHTFTIFDMETQKSFRIKGRNLYKNGVLRKKWDDEKKRALVLQDKYLRGLEARKAREERIKESYFNNYDI